MLGDCVVDVTIVPHLPAPDRAGHERPGQHHRCWRNGHDPECACVSQGEQERLEQHRSVRSLRAESGHCREQGRPEV
jgi:hypothetical protein